MSPANQLLPDQSRWAHFSPDRQYRYALGRTWNPTGTRIAFIGLNPSTANETHDDPTIRRCIAFARSWGHGSFVMLNLFALVSSKPEKLFAVDDPVGDNDLHLREYSEYCSQVLFCWGHFPVGKRDLEIIRMFPNPVCLGQNQSGSPKHPLYIKGDTKPIPFDKELLLKYYKSPKSNFRK